MGILNRLFGKKQSYLPYIDAMNIIDCVRTMEEAKLANVIINDVNPKQDIQSLRDTLCNNTFNIFIKQYGRR
jgi:hypothetical protein